MYKQLGARGTEAAWYQGWQLSDEERAAFRATTIASQAAKRKALAGLCVAQKHPINTPNLDTEALMPQQEKNGLNGLSLFSGGGGLDIGFDRAGFDHVASYEIMDGAASVLRSARPGWTIFGGHDGDVRGVKWGKYRDKVDVLHGGPPCQPFSNAGRQKGANDERDMIPEFVRAVKGVKPKAFVCENVSGLTAKRFRDYIEATILRPLGSAYTIFQFMLDAADFGVPQTRRRVFFVGFSDGAAAARFEPPQPTHVHPNSEAFGQNLPVTMGVREALGLPDIGYDGLAPTLRSGLTGPRHTTSVLSSVSSLKLWNKLGVWPNGVAVDRAAASAYVAKNGDFRMSLPDCLVLQGFPANWPVTRPVYFALGLIGNSVAPPMGYQVALAVAKAMRPATL